LTAFKRELKVRGIFQLNIKLHSMKKFILDFLFLCIFIINSAFAQTGWIWQNPLPQGNDLRSSFFVNANTGWAAGRIGTILKSTNGGINWFTQSSNTDYTIVSLFFVNENLGWGAAGSKLLSTVNGGLNWNVNTVANPVYSVFFTDANTGWTVGYLGKIYKTTNAGSSWSSQGSITVNLYSICMINQFTGYVGGDYGKVFKTVDGGNNWSDFSNGTYITSSVNSISFVNVNTGWIASGCRVYCSTNGGINWQSQLFDTSSFFNSVTLNSSLNGFSCNNNGRIYYTSNSGQNWLLQTSSTTNSLYSLTYLNSSSLLCLGNAGLILRTTNSGGNWVNIQSGNNAMLRTIFFIDSLTGWIGGESASFLKTSNGGTNWNIMSVFSGGGYVSGIHFLNSQTGWCIYGNSINKTTNGGFNWILQPYVVTGGVPFYGQFLNLNTGWVCGSSGTIWRTTNSGVNWDSSKIGSGWLTSMYFLNSLTGWVVGESGGIYKSTNGGSIWTKQTTTSTQYLNSVKFLNENTGFAGGSASNILKTTNGGINWILQMSSGYYDINSIFIIDANRVIAAANEGVVYYTSNAGSNWYIENKITHNNLKSVFFANQNTGWIAGANGSILKTTNSGFGFSTFSVSGFVRYSDNNQPVTSGKVKAFKLDKQTMNILYLDSANIQSDGSYTLINVPQDSVDIGVFPNSTPPSDWVVTYYPSTIYWEHATVIYPTGNLTNINISALRMSASSNSNSVNGKVMSLNDTPLGNLKDAILYAKNGNTFVRCAMSDAGGVYHLQSLPAGNLKIIATRLGYKRDSTTVNVTSSSNTDSINFLLSRFTVGIKQINSEVPDNFKLYQNYPNPFNSMTNVKWQMLNAGNVKIVLYDVLGKEIVTLVNEKQLPGVYEVMFDASSLPSGIYFYKLTAGDYSEVKKMVLLK